MTVFKWHLRIINWNDIQANKYGGDVYCNTYYVIEMRNEVADAYERELEKENDR